jgi:hypothetical protein
MRIAIIYFVFVFLAITAKSQTQAIRDSLIGTYYCDGVFYLGGNTSYFSDSLKPYIDNTDTLSFFVYDSIACCWFTKMKFGTDYFFISPNGLHFGDFIPPDSMILLYNCLSTQVCYFKYYCKRINIPAIGMGDVTKNNLISIYPNPVNNGLFIAFELNLININVQLKNVLGQIILNEKYPYLDNSIELDVSKINNGIYFLNVIHGEQTKSFKVIIQH